MDWAENKSILLFDGHCNLCNKSVQFVLRNSRNDQLFFLSLQSEKGKELLQEFDLPGSYDESLIFFSKGKMLTESEAALRIAPFLKWPWSWLVVFRIIPKRLRDQLYKMVARRRYKWFGKTDSCWIMQQEWKHRFL